MKGNKINWEKFAPFSLIIAGVALIAFLVFFIWKRDFKDLLVEISLALFVLGLAGFIILDPNRVRLFFAGRQARYGSNALLISLAFLGIIIVLNFIAYHNPVDWDLTADKTNTLRPETLDTLKQLPSDVKILAFYQSNQGIDNANKLLEQYKSKSDGKIDYEFIDPVADPVAAKAANVSDLQGTGPAVVLMMGDKQEKITIITEEELTNALVRLMAEKPNIYFLTGHGEASLDGSTGSSVASLKSMLDDKGYIVNTLSDISGSGIPDDARAIIIAGAQAPLLDEEAQQIATFVDGGGSLIVLSDSPYFSRADSTTDPLADYLGASWGITMGNDVLVDRSTGYEAVAYPGSLHTITDNIYQQNLTAVFFEARSVTVSSQPTNVAASELFTTSSTSWAETDFAMLDQSQQASFDEASDLIGPVGMGVAAENSVTGARVVVIGNAIFALDDYIGYLANGDLVLNSIDWVTAQESLMSLSAKDTTERLIVPPDTLRTILLIFTSFCALPLIVVVAAISMFIYRRKRA